MWRSPAARVAEAVGALRGGHAGVPDWLLHGADVGAGIQQGAGKGGAEVVGAERGHAGLKRVAREHVTYALLAHRAHLHPARAVDRGEKRPRFPLNTGRETAPKADAPAGEDDRPRPEVRLLGAISVYRRDSLAAAGQGHSLLPCTTGFPVTATASIPTTEEAWTRFHGGLHRFLLRRVGDADAADDLLQDIFLKVHAQLPRLRDPGRIHAWIYRVARNAVTDHFRARRDAGPLSGLLAAPERERDAVAELAPCIRTLIARLPAADREALELTELGDLAQAELARRLGISVSGAKSRVQRARARLKAAVLECCQVYLDAAGRVTDYAPGPACRCRREAGEPFA